MYLMDYSGVSNDQISDLINSSSQFDWDDAIRLLQSIGNGAFIQYRDDDGNVFRLVATEGRNVKKISPRWDM